MCTELCMCDYCGRNGSVVHHKEVPETYKYANSFCWPGDCFRAYGECVNKEDKLMLPFCHLFPAPGIHNFKIKCVYCGTGLHKSLVESNQSPLSVIITQWEENVCCDACFKYCKIKC